MTTRARTTDVTLADLIGDVPAPGSLLNWRHHLHHRRPAPCVLCRRPTPLRSHADEAAHKVCAEQWIAAHPDEALRSGRFVSDRKTPTNTDHA